VALRICATVTDLFAVKMRCGKIVHYHGPIQVSLQRCR
jgi:hypothetical protein